MKSKEELERYVHEKIFPRVASWQRDYLTQFFTTIFNDGFESGNFSAWTGTSIDSGATLTVVTEQKHHGNYSEKAYCPETTGAFAYKTFSSVPVAYARAYTMFSSWSLDTNQPIDLIAFISTVGWTYSAGARINKASDGNVYWGVYVWQAGSQYTVYESTPSNPTAGVWYCVEIMRDVTNDVAKVWIDGVLKATCNIAMTNDNAEFDCGIGWSYYSSITAYFDCVVVADAYIGPEGGAQLIQVTDSLSLSDSALRNKTFTIADQIGLSETPLRDWTPQIADAVTLSDSIFTSKIFQVLDSLSLSDVILVNKVLEILDAVGLFDLADKLAARAVKTRIFLIIGDLAIQLTGGE